MSSDNPSTPPPAGSAASGYGDGSEMSTSGMSYGHPEASDKTVDYEFHENHLSRGPILQGSEVHALVQEIIDAGTVESKLYGPTRKLLTLCSIRHYEGLPQALKEGFHGRCHLPDGHTHEHLTFIDHHSTTPTHFPHDAVGHCSVKEKPDLLGVVDDQDYTNNDGVYKGVPHHHVETIIEAKPEKKGGGRAQAAAYAYRHHQARPDHPMMYCLVIKPQWYQVLLSSPTGVMASPQTDWSNLTLLSDYVDSHHNPPPGHFLFDETIRWESGENPGDLPSWSIRFKGEDYTNGTLLSIGAPWGRRTVVKIAYDKDGAPMVFKEVFPHFKRRFKEEEILERIHKEGGNPGVVRMVGAEVVKAGDEAIRCGSEEEYSLRVKHRLALPDHGYGVLKTRSVNDFLGAMYDVLEVHRTLLKGPMVLHRDMSIYNVLMYPECAKLPNRKVYKDAPPTIEDVLNGHNRPLEQRTAKGLIIDVENAALLDTNDLANVDEFMHRTGTPMYIARSVSVGMVLKDDYVLRAQSMPTLTGKALELYCKAYGSARYELYNEKDTKTRHGALPPEKEAHEITDIPAFTHRPEHDVESNFFTLLTVLLHLQPLSAPQEDYASEAITAIWATLRGHSIPNNPGVCSERRGWILQLNLEQWQCHFPPVMKDVARMIWLIARQISPEYALFQGHLEIDHLHEAVQRIILQYLVDHHDQPIPVDPEHLRPMREKRTVAKSEIEPLSGGTKGPTQAESSRAFEVNITGSRQASEWTRSTCGSVRKGASAQAGPSRGSAHRRSIQATPANREVDEGEGHKRSSESPGGRGSKRRKRPSGPQAAVSTEDDG